LAIWLDNNTGYKSRRVQQIVAIQLAPLPPALDPESQFAARPWKDWHFHWKITSAPKIGGPAARCESSFEKVQRCIAIGSLTLERLELPLENNKRCKNRWWSSSLRRIVAFDRSAFGESSSSTFDLYRFSLDNYTRF